MEASAEAKLIQLSAEFAAVAANLEDPIPLATMPGGDIVQIAHSIETGEAWSKIVVDARLESCTAMRAESSDKEEVNVCTPMGRRGDLYGIA